MEKKKRVDPIPVDSNQIRAMTEWYSNKSKPSRVCAIRKYGSDNEDACFVVYDACWNPASQYYTCDEPDGGPAYEKLCAEIGAGKWENISDKKVEASIRDNIQNTFDNRNSYDGESKCYD